MADSALQNSSGFEDEETRQDPGIASTGSPSSPGTSVPEFMDDDDLQAMFSFPSVNKKALFSDSMNDILSRVRPMNATVYQGDFISQYTEKTRRFFGPQIYKSLGSLVEISGETISELGELNIDADIYDTFGSRLRNFGLHMGAEARRTLQEREELFPVEGTPGAFAADVTSSILASVGLAAGAAVAIPGATVGTLAAVPAAVFAAQSGLDVFSEGREAGASYERSLAFGILDGVIVNKLERIGLKKIFGGTFVSGKSFIKRQILAAASREGVTEGAQTGTEIAAGFATGARTTENTNVYDVVSEMAYATAVGIVAGGAMTTGVAIPQKAKAIRMLQQTGMDKTEAAKVFTETVQQTADDMVAKVGQDFGFDEVVDASYNKFHRIVDDYMNRRGGFTREDLDKSLQEIDSVDPAKQILSRLFAETEAEVRGEQDFSGVRAVPTGEVTRAEETMQAIEKSQSEETSFESFQVPEPTFKVSTTEEMRRVVKGRINYINTRLKAILKNTNKNRKLLKSQVESERPRAQIEQDMNKDFDEAIALVAEANAIRANPDTPKLAGDKIELSVRDMIVAISRLAQTVVREAKRNFKAGRAAGKAEMLFVRAALNKLVNQPGISRSTRALIKQRFLNASAVNLQKQIPIIEEIVRDAQNDALIVVFKEALGKLNSFFKGSTKKVAKLDLETKKLADVFVQEYENESTNPQEVRMLLDGTKESLVRLMASQAATGKNAVTGEELSPQDYSRIFQTMNDLAVNGKRSAFFNAETNRKIKEKIANKVAEDILAGKADTDTLFGNADIGDRLIATAMNWAGTYNGLISMFARHAGDVLGGSFTETIADLTLAERKADTLRVFYTSEMDSVGKKAFNLKTSRELTNKLYQDSSRLPEHILVIRQPVDEEGAAEKAPKKLSRAEAREKYLVSLRPEGKKKLLKDGWTEEGVNNLTEVLSDQDLEYVQGQLKVYSELYPKINEVYQKLTGMELPQSKFYSPLFTKYDMEEGVSVISGLFNVQPNNTPGVNSESFLQSVTNRDVRLQDIPDFQKMSRYISDASYYVGAAETINRIQGVFSSQRVRDAVRSRFGNDSVRLVDRFVQVFVRNSLNTEENKLMGAANRYITRFTQGYIAAKPSQIIKQFTSALAAIEVMGPAAYVKYFPSFMEAIRTGEIRKLIDDPYLRARGMFRTQGRELRHIQETIDYDNSRTFIDHFNNPKLKTLENRVNRVMNNPDVNNFFFMFTQLGDVGGVLANAWPLYKWYQSPEGGGLSEVEARLKTLDHVDKTQQSGSHTQLSRLMLTANPWLRLVTAFTQAPIQYMNRALLLFNTLGTDKMDWNNKAHVRRFANNYITYFLILPYLFQFVSNAFKLPDEDDLSGVMARPFIGPFDSAHFIGPILEWAVASTMADGYNLVTGEEIKQPKVRVQDVAGTMSSVFTNVVQARKAIADIIEDGGPTLETFLKATTELAEASFPFTGGFGATVRQVSNTFEGLVLAQDGTLTESWRRYLMTLGYSRFATQE